MEFRIRLQVAEALGDDNRWFCSQAHQKPIDDRDLLLTHYIKHGGAAIFAIRFSQAMDQVNKWYCSEFYKREVREPEILWDYYSKNARPIAAWCSQNNRWAN